MNRNKELEQEPGWITQERILRQIDYAQRFNKPGNNEPTNRLNALIGEAIQNRLRLQQTRRGV